MPETYMGIRTAGCKSVWGRMPFPLLPVGVDMSLSGARDTMGEMTTSGADGHRELTASESPREELRVGISGGSKGIAPHLVSRIFVVSDGDVARSVTECGDGENPRKK